MQTVSWYVEVMPDGSDVVMRYHRGGERRTHETEAHLTDLMSGEVNSRGRHDIQW